MRIDRVTLLRVIDRASRRAAKPFELVKPDLRPEARFRDPVGHRAEDFESLYRAKKHLHALVERLGRSRAGA